MKQQGHKNFLNRDQVAKNYKAELIKLILPQPIDQWLIDLSKLANRQLQEVKRWQLHKEQATKSVNKIASVYRMKKQRKIYL